MTHIRRQLSEDEYLDDDSQYRELFLGACFGVGLAQRGRDDLHILMVALVEDDEHWFVSRYGSGSSGWVDERIAVFQAAKEWCEKNADPDIQRGIQYGWRFRS